jgi:hypothetical protein
VRHAAGLSTSEDVDIRSPVLTKGINSIMSLYEFIVSRHTHLQHNTSHESPWSRVIAMREDVEKEGKKQRTKRENRQSHCIAIIQDQGSFSHVTQC